VIHLKRKEYAQAIKSFESALEAHRNRYQHFTLQKGKRYLVTTGRQLLPAPLSLYPLGGALINASSYVEDPVMVFHLGMAHFAMGHYANARDALDSLGPIENLRPQLRKQVSDRIRDCERNLEK